MARLINRLASMFLDHISMTFILIPFMIGYLVLMQFIFDSSYPDSILINRNVSYTILFLPILIYLLKDSYKGKSIGKRVIGLQVINRSTNTPANSLQCFVRNLLIPFIWPLEVLISLFSPTRRLGDLIANTKVVVAEKEKLKTIFKDIKQTKFSLYTILIFVIGLIYCYFIANLLLYINNLSYS